MPTYVMLANWTDQGMRSIDDSPKRIDTARKSLDDMGGHFLSVYMTMGQHDVVITYDAPDDAVAARFTLLLGKLGNVRTISMKAFPEEAYRQIVNTLR
ncbi:MAG: GYD domain-containing protein [Acetobacteraceae bacterium]|nr:GYD domain-containing protein [Acetobacteraceae bacterium]